MYTCCVQSGVCILCNFQSVVCAVVSLLCAVVSLCYVKWLVCVMCSLSMLDPPHAKKKPKVLCRKQKFRTRHYHLLLHFGTCPTPEVQNWRNLNYSL